MAGTADPGPVGDATTSKRPGSEAGVGERLQGAAQGIRDQLARREE